MRALPFAITLDPASSLANRTGSWRIERPVYVDRLPPCNDACPAGENVQRWLSLAEEGAYEAAWRCIVEEDPLPAIMGRACFRPCETACNRAEVDEAVGINAVERFLGDTALEAGWSFDPAPPVNGGRVLVVGAGPAGLSAGYHLRRLGHAVVVREAAPLPGGMLRYGIPAYRLPRQVVQAEIDRIVALGIDLELGAPVEDLHRAMAQGGFDAAFVAVGAQLGADPSVPAGDSARILEAVDVLRQTAGGAPPMLGRRVAVYGGGDTAMDAARTARRLGATDAVVVYRRTRQRMPAHDQEVHEAEEEGITWRWLSTVARADAGRLVLEKMVLDDTGFPRPTGELEELDADCLVLAVGEQPDLALLESMDDVVTARGAVAVGADLMTGRTGVYAGGDVLSGDHTITVAVGHGKKAARAIDARLRGIAPAVSPRHALATAESLNAWYYTDAPRSVRPRLDAARRSSTFDEVVGGLDRATALFEARRCLSCGNCFECDNCYGVCPDGAVSKLGPGRRFEFDYDYCKGCGLCVQECPCGAIEMVPEEI